MLKICIRICTTASGKEGYEKIQTDGFVPCSLARGWPRPPSDKCQRTLGRAKPFPPTTTLETDNQISLLYAVSCPTLPWR